MFERGPLRELAIILHHCAPLDKRFVEIMDEQLDALSYEFSEMFIDGFKLGGKDNGRSFQERVGGREQEKADALSEQLPFLELTNLKLSFYCNKVCSFIAIMSL